MNEYKKGQYNIVTAGRIERLKARLQAVNERLLKIPAVQLIQRTAVGISEIDGANKAAAVSYYAFLSVFPLLLGFIALFGFFLPLAHYQDDLLAFVGSSLPGASDIISRNISGIVSMRGVLSVVSLVFLFWSGSTMFGAVSLSINRAWEIRQLRPFYIRKASELGMAAGTGILFLLSLGASASISVLSRLFHSPVTDLVIVNLGSRLVAFLLILAVFLLLYKLVPNTRTFWRYIWPGALLAAVLFEIASSLFIYYLEKFANYQLVYGPISSVIIFLVWIYYSAYIMLLGAEFSFQYGRMRYNVDMARALAPKARNIAQGIEKE